MAIPDSWSGHGLPISTIPICLSLGAYILSVIWLCLLALSSPESSWPRCSLQPSAEPRQIQQHSAFIKGFGSRRSRFRLGYFLPFIHECSLGAAEAGTSLWLPASS